MKYKLIVADFDDTILNSNQEYSAELVSAIKRYTEAGGHFHIGTGRMTTAVTDEAKAMGLHGDLITYQGSVVVDIDSGRVVEKTVIPYETALTIARAIEERGWYYHIYDHDHFILKEHTAFSKIYQQFCHCGAMELHGNVSEFIKEHHYEPPKIMIMAAPDEAPLIRAEMTERFQGLVHVNTSKDWMVEVVSKYIDKGIAVSRLAQRLGVSQEETICVGDSMNDAPMIAWAGLGVVLANGSAEAKSYADVIGPSNDDDGVAYVIKKYGLMEEV